MRINLLTATLCGFALTAQAWNASENSIWIDGSIKGKISDSVSIKLAQQIRYKDEGDFNHYRHTDFGTEWTFSKNGSTSLAYRHIMSRKPEKDWVDKSMALYNLTHKIELGVLELKSRLRFSYLLLEGTEDRSDFRPKFALLPQKGWTDWKLKPYAAFEAMYNFEENIAYRYRASGGLQLAPMKRLSLNVFITQERTRIAKNNVWNETFNMGLLASIKF